MDAQNASEAASTKPAASSASPSHSSRHGPDADRTKASSPSVTKSPSLSRLPPPSAAKDAPVSTGKLSKSQPQPAESALPDKEASSSKASASTSTTSPSSKGAKSNGGSSSRDSKQDDDGGGTDGNSEAETIVLSKDGSPSKPRNRKVIKHEDKRNGDSTGNTMSSHGDSASSNQKHGADKKEPHVLKAEKSSLSAPSQDSVTGKSAKGSATSDPSVQMKRKRLQERHQQQQASSHSRNHDASSSLSSAPGSPSRSRQHSTNPPSGSDSERGRAAKSPKSLSSKDRLRPPEKLVPHKRKASKAGSDDEAEIRKARRQRLANSGSTGEPTSHSTPRTTKEHSRHERSSTSKSSTSRQHAETSHNRSLSPPPRAHRRSLSTQALPSQANGLGQKKKRVPAPLQSTDYHSDESSGGGSPRMRSSKLRSLATPATADSVSPAKIGPHKKHLDAHGQTFLARACARGEYDLAKQRLGERPEDLNVADFAGNTPLQIAAINGYGNIVKFLIDAGCNLDCVNYDKDTPLLDAVDNGHLEVVKLLLDAGVNPRKANVNGEEPLDRVGDEIDHATEIRAALVAARKRVGERRLTSEEHHHEHDDGRFSHGPDSPRRSPAPSSHATASGRRAGTVRATKTSNHLLYMPMDDKTLRLAAGRGDEETVTRILQVRDVFDDAESMVAAARGGHDIVMQLLLALGRANPDPPPVSSMPPEHATPMLAAIGQENLNVVNLLLEQSTFNPTQKFRGETYYEIARQRAGPNWKEEEDVLKKAYDNYKKSHPGKEARKTARAEAREDSSSRAHKRKLSSPSQERVKRSGTTAKASASGNSASPREEKLLQKRSSDHSSHGDGQASPKRSSSSLSSAAKHKRENDRNSVTSVAERDTPPPSKQVTKSKKVDSDAVTVSSEGETVKPRRKLISGRELKGERERERQRRASLASNAPLKDASSPHDSRHDESTSDKARAEKHRERDRDRARLLKKEESKDSASGDGTGKRHRASETPPRQASSDKDAGEAPLKRRRLDPENSTKEKKSSKMRASPDEPPSKSSNSTARDATTSSKSKRRDDDDRKTASSLLKSKRREASSDRARKETSKPSAVTIEKSIHVKSEDVDVDMVDIDTDARQSSSTIAAATTSAASDSRAARDKDEEKKKKAEADAQQAAEAKKKEEEVQRRRQEDELKRKKEEEKRKKEEEKRKREEEEAKRKEEEEKERKRKQLELEEKKRKEEEERQKERKRLEEEERKRKEEEKKRKEEERKRKEEEEKKRKEEEEREKERERERERKRKEEEERKRREEEERLRKEQLEKEAAEEARRKREEEERKERERKEQERKERERKEKERIRAEKEAEEQRRRQLEEEERIRVGKLPPLLRWLSVYPNTKSASVAQKFSLMQGVRYDCLNLAATGSADGREQWLLNTQVALLLGEKDLGLSQYSSWKRVPASIIAKKVIWRLESDRYALTSPDLYEIGMQLPGYYGNDDPQTMSYRVTERLRGEAWEKFSNTDMFFVKASEVMDILPTIPHLRGLRLTIAYRELPEDEALLGKYMATQKWKNDPDADRFYGFAPRNKFYVNGKMVKEEQPGMSQVSKTPFPTTFIPRRNLRALSAEDPEYKRQLSENGADAPVSPTLSRRTPNLPNGTSHSPKPTSRKVNGRASHSHPVVNGDSAGRSVSLPNGQASRPLVNGINGTRS